MLPKERIAKLLDNGLSKKPLMLHGTSLESLLVLFNTGTLPPGRARPGTKNFLYFANVEKNLASKYSYMKGFSNSDALMTAEGYANTIAEQFYINSELISAGIDQEWVEKIRRNFLDGYRFRVPKEEKEKAKSFGDAWWDKVCAEAQKCKGVILEADECILERKLSPDPDDDGIRVFCPEGLHAKYFKGVRLLGSKEKEIVRKYLDQQQVISSCCLDYFT